MKRKFVKIFLLILIVCIAFTGYIRGCNSEVYPKQHPISISKKDSLKHARVSLRDSCILVAAGEHYQKSYFHKFFFGKHQRDLWALPVQMKVFDIGREKGGLTIIKSGGSMQTLNLRLRSKDGKEYVLRSIDKDQSKALPPATKNKITVWIFRDQTAALNPYGALIVPKLAESAGLLHTNPELFFVPYDPRFNQYADMFEGRVVLLEEFFDKTWTGIPPFENTKNIIGTPEMLQKRYCSHDVSIDDKAFVKARLFDLLINDWDRHVDQWKWAEYIEGGKTIYKPIPRDRDMAFYKFNTGLLPQITLAINPKFQSFDHNYKNIKGLVKNARYLDGLILNKLSKEEFIAISMELQRDMSNEAIEQAVRSLPDEAFEKTGQDIISKLKSRRDNLTSAAEEYYEILFEEVKVVGTDEKEQFIIERMNDDFTSVTIENSKGKKVFKYIYNHRFTKEVNLYGLKGNDEFLIKGKTHKGITVNVYGGEHPDKIKDESHVKGYLKKTKVYDSKNGNEIESNEETIDLTSYDPQDIYYDRTGVRR